MLNKKNSKVYKLMYHLIIVVKYRKHIFNNNIIINDIKEKIRQISIDFNVKIIEQEIDKDHIHILLETEPTLNLTKYINILKGHSSRYLRKKYLNEIKNKLYGDSFWSDSYYIATCGNVNLTKLKKYLDDQEKTQ